jgi:hypothetical protein
MTQFSNKCTLYAVMMRTLPLFSICLLMSLSATQAYAFGKMFSSFKGRNSTSSTEATVPIGCTTGMCTNNPFRNEPVQPIPQDGLANGAARVLTTLYGACDAARPLNSININAVSRNRAWRAAQATTSQSDAAANADWKVHVPGFNEPNRDLREISNSAQFNQSGPYAAALRGRMCRSNPGFNVAGAPKAFGMGAGGAMVGGQYNITRCGQSSYVNALSPVQKAYRCGLTPGSQPAITIDCAEFIGAAAVASCKKLHKDQVLDGSGFKFPGGRELSTAAMVSVGKSGGGSCLSNTPNISPDSSIQAGDIFAGASAHSVMITRVGNDPLGISKAKRRTGGCDSLSYNDMDFDMAHSPSHASLGPINSSARAYASLIDRAQITNPYPLNKILAMAKVLCKRQAAGSAQSFMNDSKFSLLRHKTSDPGCSYPPGQCPKVAGDQCADECGV